MSRSLPSLSHRATLFFTALTLGILLIPSTLPVNAATTAHSNSFYEKGEEVLAYGGGNGASVFAVVPETPFNTQHSFLQTITHTSSIPFTPEQRALATGATLSLGIALFALYTWRMGMPA